MQRHLPTQRGEGAGGIGEVGGGEGIEGFGVGVGDLGFHRGWRVVFRRWGGGAGGDEGGEGEVGEDGGEDGEEVERCGEEDVGEDAVVVEDVAGEYGFSRASQVRLVGKLVP